MTLRIPAKVLLHVWSYDFYDMTLSTGKQQRHMIKAHNIDKCLKSDTYLSQRHCYFMEKSNILTSMSMHTQKHDVPVHSSSNS